MVNKKTKVAVGVGTGLLAAGAAGYYFFASKNAKKNRKIAALWAGKMKLQAEKKIKALEKMDRAAIAKVIDGVAASYKSTKKISKKELSAAVTELKKNWKRLVK